MTAKHQLSKAEAQALFEYRDGLLYWRSAGSGQRGDRLAITSRSAGAQAGRDKNERSKNARAQAGRNKKERDKSTRAQAGRKKRYVLIGGTQYAAHYLVWNWHHGVSSAPVEIVDKAAGLHIENLRQAFIAPRLRPTRASCPCCGQAVAAPSVDMLIMLHGLTGQEAIVFRAIWAGGGRPVVSERVFDVMYADDPEGGPTPTKMYAAFKVALHHVRRKLKGSGVGIVSCGYGGGFKLVIRPESEDAADAVDEG